MSRADRAFITVLAGSVVGGAVLVFPLAITLFPSELQRALHGTREFAFACASSVYRIGAELPPLGVAVLALSLLSAALGASRLVRTMCRTRALLAERHEARAPTRLLRAAAKVGIADRVRCLEDPRPVAYCAGLARAEVWISIAAVRRLRGAELEAVLWHEAHHLQRRDPLRLLVARVLASALFALPWVRALSERFEVAAELEADRAAIDAQKDRAPLAGALYKVGSVRRSREAAIGAWSLAHARVEQLYGAAPERLLPCAPAPVRVASLASLTLAILLAVGQATRANLIPAEVLDALLPAVAAGVHLCPVTLGGILF